MIDTNELFRAALCRLLRLAQVYSVADEFIVGELQSTLEAFDYTANVNR